MNNDPEFATPKECNPNPEPHEMINADDDPAESSLHVITIGQKRIKTIGYILHHELSLLTAENKKHRKHSEQGSSYWDTRIRETNHQIAETKALIKMILGAESIDIKHHVNPLAGKE